MAKKARTPVAKVFMSGKSQAVRLPQAFRFDCETVSISRDGDSLILTPLPRTWADLRLSDSEHFDDDFIAAVLDDGDLLPLEKRVAIES